MRMPQEGRIKYPPRSYHTCGELDSESRIGPPHLHRECSEFNSSSTTEQPHLINNGFSKGSNHLVQPSPHSSIIEDWTWESFAIGIGAGTIHIILADLNRHNKRLVFGLEVFFYFTDVILFLCNTAMFITQHIRGNRRIKSTFENTDRSLILSLIPINLATILTGSFRYGLASGWLQLDGAICLFHCYIILLISILTPHCLMWFKLPHFLEKLPTSFYLLPIPILLTGVMATHVLNVMPFENRSPLSVLITGYLFGGSGIALTLAFLLVFFFRMVLHGHGEGEQTVISILVAGFPAFCAQTVIGLGINSRIIFDESPNMNLNDTLGEVWYSIGILVGLMFVGLSLALVLMAISNSWWKRAPNSRPKLALWMISITCCSWAISSACSPLGIIFDSTSLRAVQLAFAASAVITYLVLLPVIIMRYFRKISGRRQSRPSTSAPAGFVLHNHDQLRSAELQKFSINHRNFAEMCTQFNQADRSSVSKPYPTRNSGLSQTTVVVGQNTKTDPNSS